MASTDLSKKRLALAIIDFLNRSVKDGTIASDDADSIEIATNCIAESFKVDAADEKALQDATGGKSLLEVYAVYEKLKGGTKGGAAASAGSSTAGAAAGASAGSSTTAQPDAKTKEEAEALKSQGNAAIQKKDYSAAVDFYTKALELVPLNPVYLSNRAAAHSGAGEHEEAVKDADLAVAADPKFAKAWSRLGFAKFALGDAKGSMEAYKKGIDAEGSGGSEAMRRGYETAKRKVEAEGGADLDEDDDEQIDVGARGFGGPGAGGLPDLSSLAGMFGGGAPGAGPGAGGMPGLAEMLQNPMMRQMAQNLMSNPDMMSNLMNNPNLRNMFGGAGGPGGPGGADGPGGGGMPDLSTLMQDPSIAEIARNLMGGGAGGPGGAGGAGRGRGQ